ncbi:L-seryl-tRNA(Sec) selenium transferase [Fodinicola acaciae]|uniref:L-seryl-tRNA(Sec) selenium transferase n=1 Tax=Fodinicola acaciae TaxID=2681555 RepID=UPI0013D6D833|nr:L-seryl-tRNA(Sec) selenium transferase [Fodinicola acaciae]
MTDARRQIPRTDMLLADPRLVAAAERIGYQLVKTAVAAAQQAARDGTIAPESIVDTVVRSLPERATSLRPVVNATGILVHTNLGRAPLSSAAIEAIVGAAGVTDVEFDLGAGQRARRGRSAVEALADAVPTAEAAHVVNNNAAALLLVALALAGDGREIVISRGELVEIGDGFRIPELLASTGAVLREVGATNRTRLADYADVIGENTAFILKVHPSNFIVSGFTREVGVRELAGLGVPVVADIGSGLLKPHPLLPDEPDATTSLAEGATLVTASGDKLLGGPQAGLMLGKTELVERLRRHPAARALRVDKLTLAALEATLRGPLPPVRAMLATPTRDLLARAEKIAAELRNAGIAATSVESEAAVGGGGAPGVRLPSAAVSLPPEYAAKLRKTSRPIVGRTERNQCLLDLFAVDPEQDADLVRAVREAG